MRIENIDFGPLDQTIAGLESILQDSRSKPGLKSDELFIQLVVNETRRIRYAKEEGKPLVVTTVLMPSEILYAMDIVPMPIEYIAFLITHLTNSYEEAFSAAKAFGFAPEICSVHRIVSGQCIRGTIPKPDAVIWSSQVCDNTVKGADCMLELYGCPGFFLDRPYRYTEVDVRYLTGALEDMVRFLEDVTRRKLDHDRLKEVVKVSTRELAIVREIRELRRAIPAPLKSRTFCHYAVVEALFQGSPEALGWIEQVRDEVKANVEQKRGVVPQERYRLIHLFIPPFNMWELIDWLESDHGAVSVAEPYCFTWGPGDPDPERPLESLARKCFYKPIARQMHGPIEEGVLADTFTDAREFKAEGAIFWAHIGCREACACIKMLKDGLMEKLGIPMLVLDNDIYDPTYVTIDQIKDKLEGFLEILDDRK